MSTRQKKNSRLKRFAIPLVCVVLTAYFLHHAWSGRFGLEASARIADDEVRLQYELVRLKHQRQELEARVRLLRDGTLEQDMLDEQSRRMLGVTAADEIVILR
ncbi:MAG: septum formation initiator family protein [Nitratireductor sp.]|nr:septum formation initiator family protein [Nitratireductor sp.]MCB1458719.1 septum formation initiator family protein [Nitratireductor sp.]